MMNMMDLECLLLAQGSLDGNGMGCLKLILKVVFLYGPPFIAFPLLE